MWAWLRPVLLALLDWLEAYARKPRQLEDANTPPGVRARWAAWLRDRLRDQNGGDRQPQ